MVQCSVASCLFFIITRFYYTDLFLSENDMFWQRNPAGADDLVTNSDELKRRCGYVDISKGFSSFRVTKHFSDYILICYTSVRFHIVSGE